MRWVQPPDVHRWLGVKSLKPSRHHHHHVPNPPSSGVRLVVSVFGEKERGKGCFGESRRCLTCQAPAALTARVWQNGVHRLHREQPETPSLSLAGPRGGRALPALQFLEVKPRNGNIGQKRRTLRLTENITIFRELLQTAAEGESRRPAPKLPGSSFNPSRPAAARAAPELGSMQRPHFNPFINSLAPYPPRLHQRSICIPNDTHPRPGRSSPPAARRWATAAPGRFQTSPPQDLERFPAGSHRPQSISRPGGDLLFISDSSSQLGDSSPKGNKQGGRGDVGSPAST